MRQYNQVLFEDFVGAFLSKASVRAWLEISGGGGAGIWGSITGTITDQTDLINYISALYSNIDGGFANSVYLLSELLDGGGA
jgi:hypothetical protein